MAYVADAPITKASYEHWLAVEKALGAGGSASHRALGFLITSEWVAAESAARGVSLTEAQLKQHLDGLERQSFPKAGALSAFLAKSHESEGDLLGRARTELLQSRVAEEVTAGKSASSARTVLAGFQRLFQRRWKSRTTCLSAYVMEDCSEYRGKPEPQAAADSSSTSRPSPTSSPARPESSSVNPEAEVYSSPHGMAISSPAFDRNGAMPARYTCDGANISPPLEWQRVPAGAAALVLFEIDDTPTGPASGIRWLVANIHPRTKGVAPGKVPAGGLVGSDTQGRAGYGGICPERGNTSAIEFILWALRKPLPLSPGFQPRVAESEYTDDLLGPAAVTYAVYHRP